MHYPSNICLSLTPITHPRTFAYHDSLCFLAESFTMKSPQAAVLCAVAACIVASGPSCPTAQLSPMSYTGENVCSQGPSNVGAGMLSGSAYKVAAFYFGNQY